MFCDTHLEYKKSSMDRKGISGVVGWEAWEANLAKPVLPKGRGRRKCNEALLFLNLVKKKLSNLIIIINTIN